jgi:acetamidase/formamidase
LKAAVKSSAPQNIIEVTKYTHGLIGPDVGFFGTLKDGGRISAVTPPGCWGPMITPGFQGGHEVTQPIFVEGAEVGDAIALFIEQVDVMSLAATSGVMSVNKSAFGDDPFVDKKCPQCGTTWPGSRIEGTGQESVRCTNCGAEASPFHIEEGYTVAFDKESGVSLAVDEKGAHKFAMDAKKCAALPKGSEQNPILLFEPHTLAGLPVRVRASIGNIGTIPSRTIPDSHNAGDFGASLVGASHQFRLTKEELDQFKTDGHLDCKDVRPGAVLLCPVKVRGGGVYMGDCHSIIGTGELALHAIDVTAAITVRVKLVKGMDLEGPILFPNVEDLPDIAKPFTTEEKKAFKRLGKKVGVRPDIDLYPLQFIGTGENINLASDNAIQRAQKFLGISKAETLNRGTVTGCVQISRLPGVVQLSMLVPFEILERKGISDLARTQA